MVAECVLKNILIVLLNIICLSSVDIFCTPFKTYPSSIIWGTLCIKQSQTLTPYLPPCPPPPSYIPPCPPPPPHIIPPVPRALLISDHFISTLT